MPDKPQPKFAPATFTLHTQADFYTPEELESAAKPWPTGEVERAFAAYRAAVDAGDHDTMAAMLSEDGRGGNSTFGFFEGRSAYRQFLADCWLPIVPNHSMWHVVQAGRVVNRWCEVLPGTPPDGGRYDYFGINELIYAGNGLFRFQYSIPELFPLSVLYARWKADGQHETWGDIYPGLGG